MAIVQFDSNSGQGGDERRRSERADLVVRIEYSTVDDLFSEFTRDINEGGVFIETDTPQDLGSTIHLQFHLPGSDDPVKATGTVVRRNDGSEPGQLGMGVEFENLSSETRARINDLIRSMRSHL